METHKTIAEYIFKYQHNILNEQEWQVLQEWINHSDRNRKLFNRLSDKTYWEKVSRIDLEKEWQKVLNGSPVKPVNKLTPKKVIRNRMVAAACMVPLVIACYFLFVRKEEKMVQDMQRPIASHPYLQLAGGSILELDEAAAGPLARINGQEIRNENRQVKFDPVLDTSLRDIGPLYNNINTIITPKGCTYFITLPDGTEVTLNECSILKFPSQFDPNERVVELMGNEAYFNVKPCYNRITGKRVPFTVVFKKMKIGVVGTEFDVKSYNNSDSIKTSLVKGSVRLKTDAREYQLDAGKAIVLNSKGEFTGQTGVNMDEVNAWRALANFDNATIEEIMAHLKRVFGITVTYVNKTSKRFTTDISATGSLTAALNDVEFAGGVKCRLVGKNVFVEFINQ